MKEILLYLAVKYKGNWNEIFDVLSKKITPDKNEFENFIKSYKGSKYITILDDEYPKFLKTIMNPPFVLFYEGNIGLLNNKKTIGIIGSRNCSDYGIKVCKELTRGLVENNIVVISGLARGIDSVAHKTTLENDGLTIGVAPCGLNMKYPTSSSILYEDIPSYNGLIISEYPDDIMPTKDKFGIRNRIIAGLSNKILVIEAKSRSGTLLTINHALSQGKDVLCVPNNIYSDSLCNRLIKQGAKLVENVDDILEEI